MGPQHPPLTLPPWVLGTQNRRGSHPTLHVLSQSSLEATGPPCGVGVGQAAALLLALSSQTGGKMGPQLPKGGCSGPSLSDHKFPRARGVSAPAAAHHQLTGLRVRLRVQHTG